MVRREDIEQAINSAVTKVLTYGQLAVSQHQFEAFRKLTLDTFGRNGLGADLDRIFERGDVKNHGKELNGPEHTGQGKGAGMSESAHRKR